MMGLWASPTPSLWAALGLTIALLVLGFGPLHKFTAGMCDEIAAEEPDHERLASLNKKYGMLSLVELVLMIATVATMTGLRWGTEPRRCRTQAPELPEVAKVAKAPTPMWMSDWLARAWRSERLTNGCRGCVG